MNLFRYVFTHLPSVDLFPIPPTPFEAFVYPTTSVIHVILVGCWRSFPAWPGLPSFFVHKQTSLLFVQFSSKRVGSMSLRCNFSFFLCRPSRWLTSYGRRSGPQPFRGRFFLPTIALPSLFFYHILSVPLSTFTDGGGLSPPANTDFWFCQPDDILTSS